MAIRPLLTTVNYLTQTYTFDEKMHMFKLKSDAHICNKVLELRASSVSKILSLELEILKWKQSEVNS